MNDNIHNNDNNDLEQDEVPLSQHVHHQLIQTCLQQQGDTTLLREFISKPDAYIEMSAGSEAHLPPLDWNRHFRKAYTILAWIRPVVVVNESDNEDGDG